MRSLFLVVMFTAVALLSAAPGRAQCDPNEECSRCIVPNPFGGCIQYGNDPMCEIRKAACRNNVPLPFPPQPPNPVEQLAVCIQDPSHCPENFLKSHAIAIGQPITRNYLNDLRGQASGRWLSLPDRFINEFASRYPQIDLRRVRYANNIDTRHGQSMTLCYEVFLAEQFDSNSRRSIALMLHELYHTVQCVGRGGVGPFMDEYLLHGIGTIAQEGRIDIHDDIDHERDAESRSASLINEFGWPVVIDNACQTRIRVFVQILDRSKNWVSKGWYELDGGAKAGLEDGGFFDPSRYVHSSNRVWYYYAEELVS